MKEILLLRLVAGAELTLPAEGARLRKPEQRAQAQREPAEAVAVAAVVAPGVADWAAAAEQAVLEGAREP